MAGSQRPDSASAATPARAGPGSTRRRARAQAVFGGEDPAVLREYYRHMALIRSFELRAAEMYTRVKIGGYCHLNLGEGGHGGRPDGRPPGRELPVHHLPGARVRTGPGRRPRPGDGRAVRPRQRGVAGQGGSMHLSDPQLRLLGGYGIIGGQIPPATGAAFALACRGGPGPDSPAVMCLLGDATTNIAAFHESLNLAALWRLPVVYVIVNNQLGMGTPVKAASAEPAALAGHRGWARAAMTAHGTSRAHQQPDRGNSRERGSRESLGGCNDRRACQVAGGRGVGLAG